jgi:hypothetical protein
MTKKAGPLRISDKPRAWMTKNSEFNFWHIQDTFLFCIIQTGPAANQYDIHGYKGGGQ